MCVNILKCGMRDAVKRPIIRQYSYSLGSRSHRCVGWKKYIFFNSVYCTNFVRYTFYFLTSVCLFVLLKLDSFRMYTRLFCYHFVVVVVIVVFIVVVEYFITIINV